MLAFVVGGCARPQVRTQPEMPPLEVPPAPPRSVVPPPPEEPPPPAQEPETPARKPTRPRPAPARTEGTTRTDPQPPAAQPPPAPPVPTGALQTTPPASQAEAVKNIRDLLAKAQRDLGRVPYAGLNADGKAQYDTARRFIGQAEQALKDQNLVFGLTLADKAATLARSLVGG
jgi:hypothetical protein